MLKAIALFIPYSKTAKITILTWNSEVLRVLGLLMCAVCHVLAPWSPHSLKNVWSICVGGVCKPDSGATSCKVVNSQMLQKLTS